MGEVIHGDYRKWVNPETLDSVTNYVGYKGLYSSHVDQNYFELAHTLNRQFGEKGIYRDLLLYSFADNHDVNRVASQLKNPAHLYPLYSLLFTMPGVPSIYYGSEWGIEGKRTSRSDQALRPRLDYSQISQNSPHPDLPGVISRLAQIRHHSAALRYGNYRPLLVKSEQLAFARQTPEECVIVAVNAADKPVPMELPVPVTGKKQLIDLLNEGDRFPGSWRKSTHPGGESLLGTDHGSQVAGEWSDSWLSNLESTSCFPGLSLTFLSGNFTPGLMDGFYFGWVD